ncbi:hypothetical protein PGT21_024993 [Puccinia graminis f. sp. tritici]|uniref:Uncharacterized protein n=1 Tax=Puccinia graminis f. sp. tritici TaxID=56615 RepID=A0A5B0M4A6_PUCGR|nr:hypothetical protein PGT21_024993 [Puccinia graminis f. sp. tritici]
MAPSLNCRWRLGLIQTGAVTDGAEVASCSQLICARLIDAHIRLVQPVTGRRTVILLLLQPASKPQNHTARGEAMSYQLRFAKVSWMIVIERKLINFMNAATNRWSQPADENGDIPRHTRKYRYGPSTRYISAPAAATTTQQTSAQPKSTARYNRLTLHDRFTAPSVYNPSSTKFIAPARDRHRRDGYLWLIGRSIGCTVAGIIVYVHPRNLRTLPSE